MKPTPPLTQADIDRPTEPRKPVLAVYGPSRTYWPLVFWFAYGAAITALVCWLVR